MVTEKHETPIILRNFIALLKLWSLYFYRYFNVLPSLIIAKTIFELNFTSKIFPLDNHWPIMDPWVKMKVFSFNFGTYALKMTFIDLEIHFNVCWNKNRFILLHEIPETSFERKYDFSQFESIVKHCFKQFNRNHSANSTWFLFKLLRRHNSRTFQEFRNQNTFK